MMAISSLPIPSFHCFSSIMVLARTSHVVLSTRSDSEHPCPAQCSKRNAFKFSLVSIMIALRCCYIMSTKLRKS